MSVIRQDPTTKEWVILAPARGKRPDEFKQPESRQPRQTASLSCPFCPGNERMTPVELERFTGDRAEAWTVRVIANKFPALVLEGQPRRSESGPLFREMAGVGAHEVIIESPIHDRTIALMEAVEVEDIVQAYQSRYRALTDDSRLKYVIVFKNHGETAGTSLEHPHSQVVATPIAPMLMRRKYEVAMTHYDDTGRSLYQDLVDEELRAQVRVVIETDMFVAFHPFASRVPFETWIVPKRHEPSFGQAHPEELTALSHVLLRTLRGLHHALGNPDFNYILHSAPKEDESKAYYVWHLQILPRVNTIAGFELGSGIYVTTMLPEDSAAYMRTVLNPSEPDQPAGHSGASTSVGPG
jgi:UDPglucose--hexose-1-phosphate uridylyltransferase